MTKYVDGEARRMVKRDTKLILIWRSHTNSWSSTKNPLT